MKTDEFTQEQINFLKRLNALLTQKEKEIYERGKLLTEIYEKRLTGNGGDLHDYEIEVIIEYYTSGMTPRYFYTTAMHKSILNSPDNLFTSGEDWAEGSFPDLGEKWCYLMHCLYDHSHIGKSLFKIVRVDFEILIIEQQFVEMMGCEYF